MSLAAQDVAPQAIANPGDTVFPFAWRCDDSSLVDVWVNDVQDGGFTVILNADQTAAPGGTITRSTACEGGEVVTVERVSPLTQLTTFTRFGPFPASTVNTMVDKVVMLAQEAASILGKTLKAARSNFALFSSMELPAPQDGSMIAFLADVANPGKFKFQTALSASKEYVDTVISAILGGGSTHAPLSWVAIGDGVHTDYAVANAPFASPDLYYVTIDSVPQEPTTSYTLDISVAPAKIKFTTIVPLNKRIYVRVLGYARGVNVGDNSLVTATGSTAAIKLADRFAQVANVKNFGAKGDNATDDTLNAQTAINSIAAGVVVFPPGAYVISQLNMKSNVWIYSQGASFRTPNNAAVNAKLFSFNGVSNCGILGAFKADGNRANQVNTGNNGQFAVFITGACADIYIQSGFATGFSEDSLYIGGVGTTPTGITIDRWVADQAMRNGVSITNGKNIYFGYLETRNTNGAALGPWAGLDIEPNVIADSTSHIRVNHLVTYGNSYGLQVLGVLNGTALVHGDISFGRVDSYNNLSGGALIYKIQRVSILDGAFHNNTGAGIEIPRDVRNLRVRADIYLNTQRGINAALNAQTFASSDWDFSGCVCKNNSTAVGNTQDGIKLDSDDAAKVLTRVRGHGVALYDDQGAMTQRFGLTTGPNTSAIDFTGYIPANATSNYSIGGQGYVEPAARIFKSVTLDHPNIANGSYQILNATVPGAAANDQVVVAPSGWLDGLFYHAWVSGADTVRISVGNLSGGALDPGPIAWKITVIKH